MEERADDQIDHLRAAVQVPIDVDRAVRPLETVEEQLEGGGGDLERGAVLEIIAIVLAAEVAVDVVVLSRRCAMQASKSSMKQATALG